MEKKKFIIITIILFLVGGMGTFVFASNPGSFDEEDINYSKEPTYQKVDTPTIDTNPITSDPATTPSEPDNNDDISNNDNEVNNPINNNAGNTSKPGSITSNKRPSITPPNTSDNNNQGNQNPTEPVEKPEDNTPIVTPPSIDDSEPIYKPTKPTNEDKTSPIVTIVTSNDNGTKKTFRDIVVTITANEKIQPIEGWELDSTETILTRTFGREIFETDKDTGKLIIKDINNILIITDLAGNNTIANYEIKNFDPDSPETIVKKETDNNGNTIITIEQIFNKVPEGESGWKKNDNGDYVKTEEKTFENNNAGNSTEITRPDGSKFSINVKVNNKNGNIYNPTNKVVVMVTSNSELKSLDGWISLYDEERKEYILTNYYTETQKLEATICDIADNCIPIEEEIKNVKSVDINLEVSIWKNKEVNLIIKNTYFDSKHIPVGWNSEGNYNISLIYKPISDFINNKETIEVIDIYGNSATFEIALNDAKTEASIVKYSSAVTQ